MNRINMSELPTAPKLGTEAVQSKTVFIESAGLAHPTLTMHTFAGTELEPDPEAGMLHPQWALVYKCNKTGARRKFGVVDATPISDRMRATEQSELVKP
jgi:hypothetical protein